MLLLICCLVCFPLVVGILSLSLFCYPMLCVLSSFVNQLEGEETAGCFAFIVLRMSCYCKCSVTLPQGAAGWFAVCMIVVFPDHTHLLFYSNYHLD